MADFSLNGLISGYEDTSVGGVHTKSFYVRNVSGSVSKPQRGAAAKLYNAVAAINRRITYTSARAWGLLLLGFGLLTLIIRFVSDYFGFAEGMPLGVLIIGTVLSMLSIPLIATEKPLAVALSEFSLTDYVLFEFFCLKRVHSDGTEKGIHPALTTLAGVLLAALGLAVNPIYVAVGLFAVIYLYLTFASTEFSFFAIFLAMPYLSLFEGHELMLSGLVLVTLLSFVVRVAQGKRVYSFEQYDLVLFIMLLFVLVSGVFIKGAESFESSLVMIVLAMGYVLSGNLVVNRRLADCAIHAIIISSLPISAVAIWQFVERAVGEGGFPAVGSDATFDTPHVLAAFLMVALAFCIYFATSVTHPAARALYIVILSVTVLALFSTLCIWAVVAVAAGIIAFFAARQYRLSGLTLGVLGIVFYAVIGILALPEGMLDAISSNSFVTALGGDVIIERWRVTSLMIADNLFTGVGMGEHSFGTEHLGYTGTYAENSSSFLLEILAEAGIFALVAFLLIMLIRLIHRSRYRRYLKGSEVNAVSYVCAAALVALCVFGVFNYVWADTTMYYLFWCVFGIGSASLRIAKREYDERLSYFSDGSSVHSSSVNIELRR